MMLTRSKSKLIKDVGTLKRPTQNHENSKTNIVSVGVPLLAMKDRTELCSTPIRRPKHKRKCVISPKQQKIRHTFTTPESELESPNWKVNIPILEESPFSMSSCPDSFDVMEWDIEKALYYINSPQKPVTQRQLSHLQTSLMSPAKMISVDGSTKGKCRADGRSSKKRSKKIVSVVDLFSPSWDREEAMNQVCAIKDGRPFPIEKYPYIDVDRSARKRSLTPVQKLTLDYVKNSIRNLVANRKHNEEWLELLAWNRWTKGLSYSPYSANCIMGKQIRQELYRISRAVAPCVYFSDDLMKPIGLKIKYGSTSYVLVIHNCAIHSDKFYSTILRIFALWNGKVHGQSEYIDISRSVVPRCFYPFSVSANTLLAVDKRRKILEIIFPIRNYSAFVSVDKKTVVGDIESYCRYYFPLAGSERTQLFSNCMQIFLSDNILDVNDTYGSVVAKYGKGSWWCFFVDEMYDQDVALHDLIDKQSSDALSWAHDFDYDGADVTGNVKNLSLDQEEDSLFYP